MHFPPNFGSETAAKWHSLLRFGILRQLFSFETALLQYTDTIRRKYSNFANNIAVTLSVNSLGEHVFRISISDRENSKPAVVVMTVRGKFFFSYQV